jgi:hypothetical protein
MTARSSASSAISLSGSGAGMRSSVIPLIADALDRRAAA